MGEKVLVVLTQDDIDTAIHGLEMTGMPMAEEQFREQFGSVYRKLHAIDKEDQSDHNP